MPLTEIHKKVAYGIVKHLQTQLDEGVLEGDAAESLSGNGRQLVDSEWGGGGGGGNARIS